jgi:hypothetical protein
MTTERDGILVVGCYLVDLPLPCQGYDQTNGLLKGLEDEFELLCTPSEDPEKVWIGLRVPYTILNLNLSSAQALQKIGKEFKKITGVEGRLKACVYEY